MREGIMSHESMIIIAGFVVLIGVAFAILASMMYSPPTPLSQQKGDCAMRGGIDLRGYTRMAVDAKDAAKFITVAYHGTTFEHCSVNKNITIYDSCVIGEHDNVLLSVNDGECNFGDILPQNETGSA